MANALVVEIGAQPPGLGEGGQAMQRAPDNLGQRVWVTVAGQRREGCT